MPFLRKGNSNTSTIITVLPPACSSLRSVNSNSSMSLSDLEPSRPVHRVSGRVVSRKPDHSARPKAVCPFRLRLAWWSRREPPRPFDDMCEKCNKRGENSNENNKSGSPNSYTVNNNNFLIICLSVFFFPQQKWQSISVHGVGTGFHGTRAHGAGTQGSATRSKSMSALLKVLSSICSTTAS